MEIEYSPKAYKELEKMDNELRKYFIMHIEKISQSSSKKHLKFGMPFTVEKVTKQARLVYKDEKNKLYVVRCFSTHKAYENWYKSFK